MTDSSCNKKEKGTEDFWLLSPSEYHVNYTPAMNPTATTANTTVNFVLIKAFRWQFLVLHLAVLVAQELLALVLLLLDMVRVLAQELVPD
jgi:hypothetical protein